MAEPNPDWRPRTHPRLSLPTDVFWPRRVVVARLGDCVPFHLLLLWHWQCFLDGLPPFTDLTT